MFFFGAIDKFYWYSFDGGIVIIYHISLDIMVFETRLWVNYKKDKLRKVKNTTDSKIHDNNDGEEKSADL